MYCYIHCYTGHLVERYLAPAVATSRQQDGQYSSRNQPWAMFNFRDDTDTFAAFLFGKSESNVEKREQKASAGPVSGELELGCAVTKGNRAQQRRESRLGEPSTPVGVPAVRQHTTSHNL